MSILFINACVRENSRTLVLANHILRDMEGDVVEVNLNEEPIVPLTANFLKSANNSFTAATQTTRCFDTRDNSHKPTTL